MEELEFYRPFESNDFFYERCFLCGLDLTINKRTDEHIFPKWLQHRFGLWDQSLRILNDSKIKYRNLKIPCCKSCNNNHLSRLEISFQKLLNSNFQDLSFDDELIIFQWTAKILYGTLYKELSLLLDIKNSTIGNILQPHDIEEYSSLHLFLQSIRIPTVFGDPKPWSIFIFNYKDEDFHYINEIQNLCFSIKLGKVGITIAFEDNNVIEEFCSLLMGLKQFELDIYQFLEVSCLIFYAKNIAINSPKYISTYNNNLNVLEVITLNSLRSRPWDDSEFAFGFDQILKRQGLEEFTPVYNDGNVKTFLVKDGEKMIDIVKSNINK